jgi:hypothetical protein
MLGLLLPDLLALQPQSLAEELIAQVAVHQVDPSQGGQIYLSSVTPSLLIILGPRLLVPAKIHTNNVY